MTIIDEGILETIPLAGVDVVYQIYKCVSNVIVDGQLCSIVKVCAPCTRSSFAFLGVSFP